VSRYRCVDAQKAAGFPVVAACQAAGVSASAFYAWSASNRQEPSQAGHKEAELRRRGQRVNHKRVERLMASHGIVGHRPRRRRSLTKPDPAHHPHPISWDGCSIPTGRRWPGVGR
jgi:putative transposase